MHPTLQNTSSAISINQPTRAPSRWSVLARCIRAPFLVASLLPTFLGAAVAVGEGHSLHPLLLLWSLLGVGLLHAGGNAANEYYDWRSGADRPRPVRRFSGGSQVVNDGQVSPEGLRRVYRTCFLVALLLGFYVTALVGPWVLILGLIGLALGYWYTAPPAALCYRGLGEVTVGAAFGPLLVLGAYYVQAGCLDWLPLAVSAPVACLITAVLYINQFPDRWEDAAAGKANLVVRSQGESIAPYLWLTGLAAAGTTALLAWRSPCLAVSALPLVGLTVLAGRGARALYRTPERLEPVQGVTLVLHTLTNLGLIAAFLLV
ncbi:MAG: prenyltransferase [Bacillota bacterium]